MDGVFHICKLLSFIPSQSHNIVSQACAQKVFHYAFCMYTLSARFANALMMQGIYHKSGTRPIWTGHTSNFLVHGEHARTCWMQTLGWNLWFSDMGTCPLSGVRNGTIFSWQKGLASVYPHCIYKYSQFSNKNHEDLNDNCFPATAGHLEVGTASLRWLWGQRELCPSGVVTLRIWEFKKIHMCQGLNSHYFHIIGDGHQPNSRGLYTHYKDSLLKVGWPSPT